MDRVAKRLDLRGEVCPYTFVKSKLAMEDMGRGEVLEVVLDFPPAVKNVAKSMEMEGHEVVEVQEVDPVSWKIFVRKGGD
ncbi:MAG: sulfurtransferase TusA family protein [Thermodesulfobacteriota bacterium]